MGTKLRTRPVETPETDLWFYGRRYVERQNADGTTTSEQVPLTEDDVLHPQAGDFFVNNDIHNITGLYLKSVFQWRLANRPDARVFQDHIIDWQTGGVQPLGPDVTVLFNVGPWDPYKGTFPVRDERARVAFVIEVTSQSTRRKDLNEKVALYCRAEIPRYIIVDVMAAEHGGAIRFLVYDYSPDGPVPVELPEPDRVWLPELELWLTTDGDRVVCREPNGTIVGDYVEVARLAEAAEARAETEKTRAENEKARAETEKSRADHEKARAEIEKTRADEEKARAEAERLRADEEKARAEAEKSRAESAEHKLAALEAELRRLRGDNP